MGIYNLKLHIVSLAIKKYPTEPLSLAKHVVRLALSDHTLWTLADLTFSAQELVGQCTGKERADDYRAFAACFCKELREETFREWVSETFTIVLDRIMHQCKSA